MANDLILSLRSAVSNLVAILHLWHSPGKTGANYCTVKHIDATAKPVAALAAIALVFAAMHSRAEDALFTDDFKTADPAWGTVAVVKDERLTLNADVGKGQACINQANVFQDMILSTAARIVIGPDDADAGVIFWAKDYSDYYVAK
jgi:putative intracellular protease/amidase